MECRPKVWGWVHVVVIIVFKNKNNGRKTQFNQSIDLYSIPGLVTEKQLVAHI